ncbi:MAG: alpha/beta fold hydrolase [Alphaproteobacteria bacterium]|nr:alpha/beta fold hydrolase [Alphaproteobacteria bacterium]
MKNGVASPGLEPIAAARLSGSIDVVDLDLPPFRPRFPWWGADLQTLANRLRSMPRSVAPHTSERVKFPLPDGSGDMLLASLDQPVTSKAGRPLVILVHGLTGGEDSLYILSMAHLMLSRGSRVLRLNLRGAGPSRPLCRQHYYAGRSQDFRAVLSLLPRELTRDGVVAVGYSLGGAMLLKYLGEEGDATPLDAAATVCAPIDLAAACRHMMRRRNHLYHRYILGEMKVEATGEGAELAPAHRAAIVQARSIWEYDDRFIAPRYGFAGAEDYYERCRPTRFMGGIRIPTLVMAALDDPWIPGALYRDYDWSNRSLTPLLPAQGGHVGFHARGNRQPWSDLAVARFFDHG